LAFSWLIASVILLDDDSSSFVLLLLVEDFLVVDTVLFEWIGLVFEWERDDVVDILNPSCVVVMVGELLLEGSEGLSSEGGGW